MNKTQMPELSRALIEIVWHFGPKGLDGQCCENLSLPEFLALDKVAGTKDCPVQEVGHALGFTKSGATRIVNRLEKKGYVEKVRSDEDARVCCVIVTKDGERILKSATERYSKELERIVSRMPEESLPKMKELLITMARLLKQ